MSRLLTDSDQELHAAAQQLIEALVERGLTIATGESLTGGGICACLTSESGSSRAVRGGLVTYASDLKVSLAGVDADLVAARGVINADTAQQLAQGAARVCGADVGVGATGVAGPNGQDGHAPGDVWIAVYLRGQVLTQHLCLDGNRDQVRAATTLAAVRLAQSVIVTR